MNHDPYAATFADGVILPSGKVALVYAGEDETFSVFPDFDSLMLIQDKMDRLVRIGGFAPDGHHLTSFKLVREDDVTGISGNGIVAYGCHFHRSAVMEWATEIPSIAYYPGGLNQIEKLHGHGGKTKIEMDYSPSW